MKSFFVAITAVLSGLYLLNFTAGVFEVPDVLPVVGNLDEATAMAVFVACLRYFGYDISRFFGKKKDEIQIPKPAKVTKEFTV